MARKPLSIRIDNNLQKEIKKLAIDLEVPLNNLLEEAIHDIIGKYRRSDIIYNTALTALPQSVKKRFDK